MRMKTLLMCCAATLICSCQPALINLPARNECAEPAAPSRDPQPEAISQATAQCPALPMPEPIPSTLFIQIGNGQVKTDANGELLIRRYAQLRQQIKRQWHSKPP
jgi:hypothetical protein